jgi:hypothetical protein
MGMVMAATREEGVTKIALLLIVMIASLTLLIRSEKCRAHDVAVAYDSAEPDKTVAMDGVSLWLKARFSETDLEAFQLGDLKAEAYYCSCYDKPNKHYPYSIVLLKTPKGDLVARPEGTDGALIFTALAVRHGNQYCQVESETDCYGSFSHPCEFTDFRYGQYLAEFFPTCKSD